MIDIILLIYSIINIFTLMIWTIFHIIDDKKHFLKVNSTILKKEFHDYEFLEYDERARTITLFLFGFYGPIVLILIFVDIIKNDGI